MSSLVRGRPVKRDGKEANKTSPPNGKQKTSLSSEKAAGPAADVIDIDDIPDVDEETDMKRKKPPRKTAAKKQKTETAPAAKKGKGKSKAAPQPEDEDFAMQDDDADEDVAGPMKVNAEAQKDREEVECHLVLGSKIACEVAHNIYHHRYPEKTQLEAKKRKDRTEAGEKELAVIGHYKQAEVSGVKYNLGDCVHVFSGLAHEFIGKITEFFEKEDKSAHFGVQWFFRSFDTAIGVEGRDHDKRRIYYSDEKDENPLECVVGKVTVVRVPSKKRFDKSPRKVPKCDYYFDKGYKFVYATFFELPKDLPEPPLSEGSNFSLPNDEQSKKLSKAEGSKQEFQLLDLYCGCGAMSTGLCLGTNLAGINLVTRWAVDLNEFACISMKYNHLETTVRNEAAEDYLELLKEWKKLCEKYPEGCVVEAESEDEEDGPALPGEYEVERLLGIRWIGSVSKKDKEVMEQVDDMEGEELEDIGDTTLHRQSSNSSKENDELSKGLEFKVRWKGYAPEHDTWEPASSLEHCPERVKEFVLEGRRCKILPLPGDCDVVCGGPPCQGASGFNRFRNKASPLEDPRNKQMVVYMDIVEFLRPRFFLMENVVDILKFCDGILGKYALARAVDMNYQSKVGIMVAGCYGMPQFRARCFLFGASCDDVLPPYPMPTHKVIVRGGVPQKWERCLVAYEEYKQPEWLQMPLVLKDALSDLPAVTNYQNKDDILYEEDPQTSFQHFVRLPKRGTGGLGTLPQQKKKIMLPDHRPLCLNTDDYQRVCQIPKRKGANFRDLKGILIKEDGITVDVVRDPRELLPSGKPLVPDYAVSFIRGRSLKPFGRLWWDETVATVVTRAEPHNQIILHPEQDRVLTIRENARIQGFPDYYKLFGNIKQRYMQVGNAVAVPVATALGYSLGKSFLHENLITDETMELPRQFPYCLTIPEN